MRQVRLYVSLVILLIAPLTAWGAETAPSSAQDFLGSIRASKTLQAFLDRTVQRARAADPNLRRVALRIALIAVNPGGPPRLAHWYGTTVTSWGSPTARRQIVA